MHKVYLGLGSNQGQSIQILSSAFIQLRACGHNLRYSSLYVTKARDFEDQDNFYNCVVGIETSFGPYDLLELCHEIEQGAHRLRTIEKGPRSLDIDVLLYGDLISRSDPILIIPHPRMIERRFVLEPLCELDPKVREPQSKNLFTHYLGLVKDQIIYQSYPPRYNGDTLWQIP